MIYLIGELIIGISIMMIIGRYIGRIGIEYKIPRILIIGIILGYIILGDTNIYRKIIGGIWWVHIYEVIDVVADINIFTNSYILTILIVSTCIHIYAMKYLQGDPHKIRFITWLKMFTISMILLIISNNMITFLVSWELVGLVSFLLISFWYLSTNNSISGLQAMLTNKIGDYTLALGFYTWIHSTYILNFNNNINSYLIVTLCVIGLISKSAHISLHPWLKNAMAGPTPVSSLLHAATMVTAGIYLMLKIGTIINESISILFYVLLIGIITTIFAGSIGSNITDFKKIIAFSTCSQLAIMTLGIILGDNNAAYFHLITHAYFKALLFLGAGSVIHSIFDNQDIRFYGSLKSLMPLTYSIILIGNLTLLGIPFLSGFYSKETILDLGFAYFTLSSGILYFSIVIATLFTCYYSLKSLSTVFSSLNKSIYGSIISHDFSNYPMIILAIFSIFIGLIGHISITEQIPMLGKNLHYISGIIFSHDSNFFGVLLWSGT